MSANSPVNIPRPFTSPGRTASSPLSSSARFYGTHVENEEQTEVGLTTTIAGSDLLGTATEETPLALPRNLTIGDLPQATSPYAQYLYGALNRGQGYSTTNSARTSYTRVDTMALEHETEQAEAENIEQDEEQIQAIPTMPFVSICFLLISGKRKVMTFEPETTVGRVKELIWNTWPTGQEWSDERPPTPSHLRMLHLGKILQDEHALKAYNFPIFTAPSPPPAPTVVHLAIRPSGPALSNAEDNGDLEKKKSKSTRTRLVARFSSAPLTNETFVVK
jgi:hypothetical protein